MSLKQRCSEAIRRAGGTAFLLREEEKLPFAASLQPVLTTSGGEGTITGYATAEQAALYLCAGGNGDLLQPGNSILWMEERYHVLQVRDLDAAGERVYRWAFLQRETEGRE